MGVGISSQDGRRSPHAIDLDGVEDSEPSWQSGAMSAHQLDQLCGMNRAPVRRGQSFVKKVELLEERLLSVASDMKDALAITELSAEEQLKHQGVTVNLHKPTGFGPLAFGGRLQTRSNGSFTGTPLSSRPATAQPKDIAKAMPHIKLDTGRSSELPSNGLSSLRVNSIQRRQRGVSVSDTGALVATGRSWRQNISDAKDTAAGVVGAVSKMSAIAHVKARRTLQSDSLSFYVRDLLDDDFKQVAAAIEQYEDGRNSAHAAKNAIQAAAEAEMAEIESLRNSALNPQRISPTSTRKSLASGRKPLSPSPRPSTRSGPTGFGSSDKKGGQGLVPFRPSTARSPLSVYHSPRLSDASILSSPAANTSSMDRGVSGPMTVSVSSIQSQVLKPSEDKPTRFAKTRVSDPSGANSMVRPSTAAAANEAHPAMSKEEIIASLKRGTNLMDETAPLLSVVANRVNALPQAQGQWSSPVVHQTVNFNRAAKAGLADQYRKLVATKLKEGRYAIQVMIGEDFLLDMSGKAVSLWEIDPWVQLEPVFPARVASLEHVEGVGMGIRLLLSLVMNVEALAGAEAVKQLHVVINCIDDQASRIVSDLRAWNFCGLERENVLIMVEKQRQGFTLDRDQEKFVIAPSSAPRLTGNGFTFMHLAWPEEAFILAKEGDVGAGGGVLDPSVDGKHVIQTPALEYLASRGCQWLITRQLHDIAFLTTNVMDLDELAYGLFLNEDRSANMFVYVNGASKSFRGKNLVVETKSSSGAMEIKASSLCSPAMIQACSDLKASCGGKLSVSSHRYLSLIQHLQAKLSSPGAFKPALLFLDGFIYLRFDIADLSLSEGTVCVAFANKMPATSFISLSDAENMIPMVHSQDSADKFRGLLSHAASDHKSKDLAFSPIVKAARKPGSELDKPADIRDHHAIVKPTSRGKSVVLLLSDNPSTRMALNLVLSMLRPGYDHLHLVIVKSQSTTEPALKTLCEKYELQARASLATVTSTILHGNLMSAIEDHVERVEPDLVVVGSQSNLQVSATLPIGSISINLLRNLRCPVLYVNHQAALSRIHWDQADPDPLKVMVTVDHQSRPLLKFVCEKILNPARQDKVYLARGRATNIATNEELMTTRRLLDDFSVIAARSKVEVLKRPLDGNLVVEGPKRASSDECHIFAIQIPKGKAGSLPESITHLLKRSKSALLVFKSNNEV